ncbi:MAG: leucine-rich repeat domain-containing protein [Clostridium sp.]|nr:leucine-rich repeat domain-containing protein [Clostridium sp.]
MSIKKKVAALITMCAVTTGLFYTTENAKIVKAAEKFVKEETSLGNDNIECTVEQYDNFDINIYETYAVITKYRGKDSEVVIPEEINKIPITEIGDNAFKENKNIEKLIIPSNITTIGKYAFYGCTSLKTIEFSQGLLNIGKLAFSSCKGLENLNLPNTLKVIDEFAFSECSSLKKIDIPYSVTEIGVSAFSWCENLEEINVHEDNESYSSENKILYSKYKSILICCPAGLKENDVKINSDTTTIYDYAFNRCKNLENIIIPEGVKSIGNNAFSNCVKLSSISIPNTVEYLGYSVFYNCNNLKDVNLSSELKEIEPASFEQCIALESLVIPEKVEKISVGAFENCTSLNTIVIPKSVMQIQAAFEGLNNLVIFGEKDSYIAEYCKEKNINFIPFSSSKNVSEQEVKNTLLQEEKETKVDEIESGAKETYESNKDNEIKVYNNDIHTNNENETSTALKTKSTKKISYSNSKETVRTGDNQSILRTIFTMMSSFIVLFITSTKKKKNN